MTREELEALWSLPPARPPTPRLPIHVLIAAVRAAGAEPSDTLLDLLEQARLETQIFYDGDAIDTNEYLRRLEEFDEPELGPS